LESRRALRWTWAATLAICVFAAGAASVLQRLDVNWDLKNYHYYNAYAFLNARLAWDVAPAQLQTYYNPLPDLPFYFLVNAIPSPRVIAFAMAATTGIAAFFLLRMLAVLFPKGRVEDRLLWIALSFAVGVTGAAGLSVLGTTMNEWPPAMLLMAALWVLVSSIARTGSASTLAIAVAGSLAGIAVGLKLTYGVFGLALFVAMGSFGPARERFRRLAATAGFLFAGFFLAYGYWGVVLYREFGNPFFPYFNDIFKSPYWEPAALFDRNYGPRDVLQAIAFPLYFARESKLVAEVSFRDWRFAVLFVLSLCCLAKYLVLRRHPTLSPTLSQGRGETADAWRFLAVFTLVSYLAWLKLFGIYRYLVPLEMISGPLIVGCALYLVPGKNARRVAIVILAILIVGTTRKASWGRIDFRGTHFDVGVPDIAPKSLVIMGSSQPMAYIIAFLPPDARFVSPRNNFLDFTQANLLERRIADIIRLHAGPMYSLDYRGDDHARPVLTHYGLARDMSSCKPIRSNLDFDMLRLCRVERLGR
jgi:hypothetical protein